ncbi:hypothetical protein FOZ61_002239 [Perkinsus olseni]|uniref:Uncharacterized protein n=1 Tax=Perkinsus olseni TaxID=32597 RepID=A0A7J6LU70_PEROL|nr:hypothetical protein FOZ61_002239 [Perkinsus olseni]
MVVFCHGNQQQQVEGTCDTEEEEEEEEPPVSHRGVEPSKGRFGECRGREGIPVITLSDFNSLVTTGTFYEKPLRAPSVRGSETKRSGKASLDPKMGALVEKGYHIPQEAAAIEWPSPAGQGIYYEEDVPVGQRTVGEAIRIDTRTFYLGETCETQEEVDRREKEKRQRYRDELEAQVAEREAARKRLSGSQACTADGSEGTLSSDSPCSMVGMQSSDDHKREEKEKRAKLKAILDEQVAEQAELRARLLQERAAREAAEEERVRREIVELAVREARQRQRERTSPHAAGKGSPRRSVQPSHAGDEPPAQTVREQPASVVRWPPRLSLPLESPRVEEGDLDQTAPRRLVLVHTPASLATRTSQGAAVRPVSPSVALRQALLVSARRDFPSEPSTHRSLDRVGSKIEGVAGTMGTLHNRFGGEEHREGGLSSSPRVVQRKYLVPRNGRDEREEARSDKTPRVADSLSSSVGNSNREMVAFLRSNLGKAPGRWGAAAKAKLSIRDGRPMRDSRQGSLIAERSMANISEFVTSDLMMGTWKAPDWPEEDRLSRNTFWAKSAELLSGDSSEDSSSGPETPPYTERTVERRSVADEDDEWSESPSMSGDEELSDELDSFGSGGAAVDSRRHSSSLSSSSWGEGSLSGRMPGSRWSSAHYSALIGTVLVTEGLDCAHDIAEILHALQDRAIVAEQLSSSSDDERTSDGSSDSSFFQEFEEGAAAAGLLSIPEEDEELSFVPDESGSVGGSPLVTDRPSSAFLEDAAGTGGWSESSSSIFG